VRQAKRLDRTKSRRHLSIRRYGSAKLRLQIGIRFAQIGLCRPMQRDTVLLAASQPSTATASKRAHDANGGRSQDRILLGRQVKSDGYCSYVGERTISVQAI
jgi:hypothetical protein